MASPSALRKPTQRERTGQSAIRYAVHHPEYDEYAGRKGFLSGVAQNAVMLRFNSATFGFGFGPLEERPEWVSMSIRELVESTDFDGKTLRVAIRDAIKRGMIEREKVRGRWRYRLLPKNWPTVPAYTPPSKAELLEWESDSEENEAVTALPMEASTSAKPRVFPKRSIPKAEHMTGVEAGVDPNTIVLLHGEVKALPLRALLDGVSFRLDCENIGGVPLFVSHQTCGDRLRIRIQTETFSGEEEAKPLRRARPLSEDGFTDSKALPKRGIANTAKIENDALFTSYLTDFLRRHRRKFTHTPNFSTADGQRFLRSFKAKLLTAPIDAFHALAEPRFKTITGIHSLGLLLDIAEQAAASHAADLASAAAQLAATPPPRDPVREARVDQILREMEAKAQVDEERIAYIESRIGTWGDYKFRNRRATAEDYQRAMEKAGEEWKAARSTGSDPTEAENG